VRNELDFRKCGQLEKSCQQLLHYPESHSIAKFSAKSKEIVPAGVFHFSSSNETAYSLRQQKSRCIFIRFQHGKKKLLGSSIAADQMSR
jgi:hypothetical protein